jgi:hypothetical protein
MELYEDACLSDEYHCTEYSRKIMKTQLRKEARYFSISEEDYSYSWLSWHFFGKNGVLFWDRYQGGLVRRNVLDCF